jgi:hypothetical protein
MTHAHYELLQEVSTLAEALLQASEDARCASARQMEIRQEIGNAQILINNLKHTEKQAGDNYELKRKIVNHSYELFTAAKARLDEMESSS